MQRAIERMRRPRGGPTTRARRRRSRSLPEPGRSVRQTPPPSVPRGAVGVVGCACRKLRLPLLRPKELVTSPRDEQSCRVWWADEPGGMRMGPRVAPVDRRAATRGPRAALNGATRRRPNRKTPSTQPTWRDRQLVDRIATLTRRSRRPSPARPGAMISNRRFAKAARRQDADDLRTAITPSIDAARRTRRARLRHGPRKVRRRSSSARDRAPLLDGRALIGVLYVDVDGPGRLDGADRRPGRDGSPSSRPRAQCPPVAQRRTSRRRSSNRNTVLAMVDASSRRLIGRARQQGVIDLATSCRVSRRSIEGVATSPPSGRMARAYAIRRAVSRTSTTSYRSRRRLGAAVRRPSWRILTSGGASPTRRAPKPRLNGLHRDAREPTPAAPCIGLPILGSARASWRADRP